MTSAKLRVLIHGQFVGLLAVNAQGSIAFQYDSSWIESGFNLCPDILAFDTTLQRSPRPGIFDGLHGVFNDSLPDGWGLLLMDRVFKARLNLDPHQITALDRLAYMGSRGMGALEYEPELLAASDEDPIDLAEIATLSVLILNDDTMNVIDKLRIQGGSPGGARPKATVAFSPDKKTCLSGFRNTPKNYSHWMVKFRNDSSQGEADPVDSGRMEMAYAEMARRAGVLMPPTALIEMKVGKKKEAFFAVKRFDRDGDRKIHLLSLAGYVHADHRIPSLDYDSGVLAATKNLTRSKIDVEKAYRLMLFNVLAHNKDDHAKNFAYLYDEKTRIWGLSPAFDLTFTHGMRNCHTTAIMGKDNPEHEDLKKIAEKYGIKQWTSLLDEVRNAISKWPRIASKHGLSARRTGAIQKELAAIDRVCAPTLTPK